ncbi:MAG TPA: polyprenyl synthetase family protein [Pyrinomonadaceae bacterium]|nr:polyprenyl synthetase family protein [Pyrinomonadaceae bacterium]
MQKFASAARESFLRDSSKQVFDLIEPELDLVEKEFDRQASSNIQVIDYLGEYLRDSGGKRVRPALLILANYAVGGTATNDNVIRLATVMEMLHTATLVHDDIIDNAELRRSRASVSARFGNQTAVLMGDWLYMSAFETTVQERSLEIIDILTRLTRKMTEGELIQLTRLGRLDISESEYFDILSRKTAYLFSACCEVGAIIGGADTEQRSAMRDYGLALGVAFQLSDDILDLTGATESLGKAAGSDLLEGKLTLPLIYLLDRMPEMKAAIERVMVEGDYTAVSRPQLLQMLAERGILDEVRQRANDHAESARKSLDVLPRSEYRSCLDNVLSFVVDRNL